MSLLYSWLRGVPVSCLIPLPWSWYSSIFVWLFLCRNRIVIRYHLCLSHLCKNVIQFYLFFLFPIKCILASFDYFFLVSYFYQFFHLSSFISIDFICFLNFFLHILRSFLQVLFGSYPCCVYCFYIGHFSCCFQIPHLGLLQLFFVKLLCLQAYFFLPFLCFLSLCPSVLQFTFESEIEPVFYFQPVGYWRVNIYTTLVFVKDFSLYVCVQNEALISTNNILFLLLIFLGTLEVCFIYFFPGFVLAIFQRKF